MAINVKQKRVHGKPSGQESVLEALQNEMLSEGIATNHSTAASRKWLMEKARDITKLSAPQLFRDEAHNLISDPMKLKSGRMYMFHYDPVGKNTLQYYDRLPLVFPIERYRDGILGLNLHYLHPRLRLSLIERLRPFSTFNKNDEVIKTRFSYNLITNFARLNIAQPTVHKYLFSQMRSKFLHVQPSEWDMIAALPFERFLGENKYRVWQDSDQAIKKGTFGAAKTVGTPDTDDDR